MNLTANELIEILQLEPHPTCGMVKHTYISKIMLPKNALPAQFGSDRSTGSVLYFMVTHDSQIRLHRIHSDQMYHFYFGCPLEVLLFYPDGRCEIKVVGDDIKNGMTPQLFIPGGTYHVSRLHGKGDFSLLASSEWIGVEPKDVEMGDPDELANLHPIMKEAIFSFVKK